MNKRFEHAANERLFWRFLESYDEAVQVAELVPVDREIDPDYSIVYEEDIVTQIVEAIRSKIKELGLELKYSEFFTQQFVNDRDLENYIPLFHDFSDMVQNELELTRGYRIWSKA